MAEVAAGFLGPALEVVRWVGAPILRQFNYLCCFTTNITNLKNEAQKLQHTERDLQGIADAARNDVRLISSEVETWLRNSKEIKDEIMNEVPNVFFYYWSYKGCTILLTSRSRDVLSGMNIQKIFGMELLSEEESWFLFKEKVGTHADDTKLHSIAKEVMNECGRLPIALMTVGSALKDKVNVPAWKNALRQLKRHDPDIPDFIKKVYNPLELSYDVLEHKYKLVFLLCCLYPEDADIPLERLTYFCMGLRLFEGGMVEEWDRMHSLIDINVASYSH